MGVLLNNQKTDKRYENGDVILYEPNKEQEIYIKKKIVENINLNTDEERLGVSYNLIRYILIECTSLKEDIEQIDNDKLFELIDNGNIKIKQIMREIEKLFDEYVEDITYEEGKKLKEINSILNALNSKKDLGVIYQKLEKIFKKYKINVDLSKLDSTNPESISNMINETIRQINNK